MRRVALTFVLLAGRPARRTRAQCSRDLFACPSSGARRRTPSPGRSTPSRRTRACRRPRRRPGPSLPGPEEARRSCSRPPGSRARRSSEPTGACTCSSRRPAPGSRGLPSTSRSKAPASGASRPLPAGSSRGLRRTCRSPARRRTRRASAWRSCCRPFARSSIPPGVHGTGSPSGGSLPAVGAVVYAPSLSAFAARVTCTLGKADAASCQTIIADFLARVGSG